MDPVALLCNFYGAGPATLRSLHRAGIRTLENVLATSEWALAELLDDSPAGARRFLREARRYAESGSLAEVEVESPGSPNA